MKVTLNVPAPNGDRLAERASENLGIPERLRVDVVAAAERLEALSAGSSYDTPRIPIVALARLTPVEYKLIMTAAELFTVPQQTRRNQMTNHTHEAPHEHEHEHGGEVHAHPHTAHDHEHVEHEHDHTHDDESHKHPHVHESGDESTHSHTHE